MVDAAIFIGHGVIKGFLAGFTLGQPLKTRYGTVGNVAIAIHTHGALGPGAAVHLGNPQHIPMVYIGVVTGGKHGNAATLAYFVAVGIGNRGIIFAFNGYSHRGGGITSIVVFYLVAKALSGGFPRGQGIKAALGVVDHPAGAGAYLPLAA